MKWYQKSWLLYLMALLYVGAGFFHFTLTDNYVAMMPPYIGNARFWVLATGVAEILGGVGLLLPPTRRAAAWGIILMLIGFLSVHIYMLTSEFLTKSPYRIIPEWAYWVRLLLQAVLIAWGGLYTRKRLH